MSGLTHREHALRVAVLKVISDEAAAAYKAARGDAQAAFGPARDDGQSQQHALLPDGTEIGLLSVKAGGRQVSLPEGALEEWAAGHLPDALEPYLDDSAATDLEVIDVIRAIFPRLVRSRVRRATREALLKEIEESGGYLVDRETGDKQQVAEVTDRKATGEFTFRPAQDARDRVIVAWQQGELAGAVPFALPGVPVSQPATGPVGPQSSVQGMDLYMDEYGFWDPETAAAHARIVQGGYSTPPVEAYRMIRDGGVGAERARAWLAKHGLPLEDRYEGSGTPWPLTAVDGDSDD